MSRSLICSVFIRYWSLFELRLHQIVNKRLLIFAPQFYIYPLSCYLSLTYLWTALDARAYDPCSDRYAKVYYNHPEVQRALHANFTGISYPWDTCRFITSFECVDFWLSRKFSLYDCPVAIIGRDTVGSYWADSPKSMLPIYQELTAAGISIWVFRYIFHFNISSGLYIHINWYIQLILV